MAAGRLAILTTGHSLMDDRVYFKEVRSLVAAFGKVDYLAPTGSGSPDDLVPGVTVHSLGTGSGLLARLARVPLALAWILRNQPWSVHFHDPECLLLGPILRLLGNTRLIYDCHEVYPETILGSKRYPAAVRPLLAGTADLVERALAQSLHAVIGSDPDVVARFAGTKAIKEVIYNFPPLDLFPRPATREVSANERPILLYQGGMSEDRGLYVMIEAMSFVKRACPDAMLHLVGPMAPWLREEADRLIEALDLSEVVRIQAEVPHASIPAIVSNATIGLVPFKRTPKLMKNVSIKQFEYMACGVPVLGSDVPPVARFVTTAKAGRIFTSGDPHSLAEGALELIGDAQGRLAMGRSGRRWIENEWNWGKMEGRLLSVYERLKD